MVSPADAPESTLSRLQLDNAGEAVAVSPALSDPFNRVWGMASYVGPARLLLDGEAVEVAVNLHTFVDLADSSARPGWRGVVVDAAFVPPAGAARRAELRLPDGRGASAVLADRRLEGTGAGPLS